MTTHAMNTLNHHTSTATASVARRSPERMLRLVLAANATTSFAAGVVGSVASQWTADRLGVDSVGWTRAVGIALIVFAIDVALVVRASTTLLRRFAAFVSCLDVAWVVATAVAVATGWLSGTGVAIAVVTAIGVADFATAQLWFRHRVGR